LDIFEVIPKVGKKILIETPGAMGQCE